MSSLSALSLHPFVPSGAQYAASRRLFVELGFEELWGNDQLAFFRNGDAQFFLQNYDVRAFAENYMVRLNVPDLDAWWSAISAKELEEKYPGVKLAPPEEFPWGREVVILDLAGVCWHVGTP